MGFQTSKLWLRNDGSLCLKLTNGTGAPSVQGELVKMSLAAALTYVQSAVNERENIGTVLQSGDAAGADSWIVMGGMGPVKLDAAGAASPGLWVGSSGATAGRVQEFTPNPGFVVQHFEEVGHGAEAGGANAVVRAVIHFN